MIERIQRISNANGSRCFSSAVEVCRLEEQGYDEREYYMCGTANVYERGEDGRPRVCVADAPYVNRFVLRAPKNPKAFSGNVVVEIINPTSGMEIERMWILAHRKFLRDGDAYVGITGKPNTLKSLCAYSPERYGCLSWANPRPEVPFPFTMEEAAQSMLGSTICHEYETGLCWDMFTDLAHLLRGDGAHNPLKGYGPVKLVLTGWSQCVGYLRQYVRSFANAMEEDIYDGYVCAGGVPACYIPLNQYEWLTPVDSSQSRVDCCRVPFMVLQTESDASAWNGWFGKKQDSDSPGFPYRLYEFVGGSHDTQACLVDYYAGDSQLLRAAATIEMPPVYNGRHEKPNDYPYEYLFSAAYRNMFYWIRTGVAPRPAPRIAVDEEGRSYRDGFGNSVGGVRTCLVDYPTAHYCSGDDIGLKGADFTRNSQADFSAFGYTKPFSAALLQELYGSLENYRKLCAEHTAAQVAKGYILREDAQTLVDLAVWLAAERGLK